MKGKKSDNEFISNFILSCVKNNKSSNDEILAEAKQQISSIDIQLHKINNLKILRSKLTDVIEFFEKTSKNNDFELLKFFNLNNLDLVRFICNNVNIINNIDDLKKQTKYSEIDINLCINQLSNLHIINYINHTFSYGKEYEKYRKFF